MSLEENAMMEHVIDQSKGVFEKAYDDLVHPTAKSLGNTVSFIPRTVGVWLNKWEKWIINGEESIRLTAEAVREKAAGIPEEKLTEPEAYVAIPAIQQLSYCYGSEELREMYANLLVTSMNLDTKYQVHPSFVDIIKQLSPMDAKSVEEIRRKGGLLPIVTVRLNFEATDSFNELLIDYSTDLFELFQNPQLLCQSLQNLHRLSIINIRYDQEVIPRTVYDAFYDDSNYKQLVEQFGRADKTNITLRHGLIEFTEYGKSFCSACCAG